MTTTRTGFSNEREQFSNGGKYTFSIQQPLPPTQDPPICLLPAVLILSFQEREQRFWQSLPAGMRFPVFPGQERLPQLLKGCVQHFLSSGREEMSPPGCCRKSEIRNQWVRHVATQPSSFSILKTPGNSQQLPCLNRTLSEQEAPCPQELSCIKLSAQCLSTLHHSYVLFP